MGVYFWDALIFASTMIFDTGSKGSLNFWGSIFFGGVFFMQGVCSCNCSKKNWILFLLICSILVAVWIVYW